MNNNDLIHRAGENFAFETHPPKQIRNTGDGGVEIKVAPKIHDALVPKEAQV